MRPRAALPRFATLAALVLPALAAAQPAGPFDTRAPEPPPPPGPEVTAPGEPELVEQIAAALVARAQELYDQRAFVEAKQLAVEALVKNPRGAAAEHAKYLIKRVNERLGIAEPGAPPPVSGAPSVPVPVAPPTAIAPPRDRASQDDGLTWAARTHGGLFGGGLGAMVGSLISADQPAAGAVPVGLLGGLAMGWLAPRLVRGRAWSEAQVRTVGAGSVWGGVAGGLLADAVDVQGTTGRGVLIGASVGATLGALAGASVASADRLTPGDVALIDTLAGVGAAGGLTLGMLMQPAEGEGYSVNALVGAAGGVLAGYVWGPDTRATPRRMVRVAAAAALGGALPFALYPLVFDRTSDDDEQLVGALSTAGLISGLVLGFRWTRGLDHDAVPGDGRPTDGPTALLGRSARGRWAPGGLAIQPLSRALAPQPGMVVPVLGGAF